MYLALYRKFRPDTFEKIIGQDHIVKTLKNQIANNQVGHAYLFCGSRGTGKTSAAKVFAKAINCVNPKDSSPCNECEVCKVMNQTGNMDIIEIDAASNNRVDEIRDLREKVKYPPVNGKYKVYIIDEVHMLTDSAFNALLKTLEEPPKHVVFILATTEPHKLPATILSRVLRFDFKLVGEENLKNLLVSIFEQAGIKAEAEAISLIAKAGEGSVRDTLSIADMCASYANNNITYNDVLQVLGASDFNCLHDLAGAVLGGNIELFLELLTEQAKTGKNIITLSCDLTKYFRDLLVVKACGKSENLIELPKESLDKIKNQAKTVDLDILNEALQAFSKIESELKYTNNPQLLVEATAIGVCCKKKSDVPRHNLNSGAVSPQTIVKLTNVDMQAINIMVQEKLKSEEKTSYVTPKLKEIDEQNVFETNTPNVSNNQSARTVWGKVLINLRMQKQILIHSLCVSITDVELLNNNFIIYADDNEFAFLKNPQNYTDLVDCFKKLGYTYSVEIKLKNKQEFQEKSTVEKLKEILGVEIKIIK